MPGDGHSHQQVRGARHLLSRDGERIGADHEGSGERFVAGPEARHVGGQGETWRRQRGPLDAAEEALRLDAAGQLESASDEPEVEIAARQAHVDGPGGGLRRALRRSELVGRDREMARSAVIHADLRRHARLDGSRTGARSHREVIELDPRPRPPDSALQTDPRVDPRVVGADRGRPVAVRSVQDSPQDVRGPQRPTNGPVDRDLVEDRRSVDLLQSEGVNGGDQLAGGAGQPGFDHAVPAVERPQTDRRGSDVQPAERAKQPASADLEVARVADGIDPELAHVIRVDVVELDRPEVVVCIGERGWGRPDVLHRRVEETRDRRQRRHLLRGWRGLLAQPDSETQAVSVHVARVKASAGERREGDAEVAAVEQEDPLDAAVAPADCQALDVDAPGP